MVPRHCTTGARTLVRNVVHTRQAVSGPSCGTSIKNHCARAFSAVAASQPQPRNPPQTRSRFSISRPEGWQPRGLAVPCSDSEVVDYLRDLLPPLEFPEDVAVRIVTHNSWKTGTSGHNNRMAFVGRRALEAYLMTFIHAHTPLTPTPPLTKPPADPSPNESISHWPDPVSTVDQDFTKICEKALHTRALGERVGGVWKLEKVMRWAPNIPGHEQVSSIPEARLGDSGLYKIRGATVEAVVGGVFYQFGGVAAHRLFHTRVLPHLAPLLPLEYRKPVQAVCTRLGGPSSPLLLTSSAPSTSRSENVTQAASSSG